MRWAGHVARMGEERGAYRVLVGKQEGKRPLARPRRRWVDNIRMDLQEVGCGYVDWIGLAQDRDSWRTLVSVVMNLRVPLNAWNILTSCKPVSFSRRTLHHEVVVVVFPFQHCSDIRVLFPWAAILVLDTFIMYNSIRGPQSRAPEIWRWNLKQHFNLGMWIYFIAKFVTILIAF